MEFRQINQEILKKVYNYNWKPGTTVYAFKKDKEHKPISVVKCIIKDVNRLFWEDRGGYFSLWIHPTDINLSSISIDYYPNGNKNGEVYSTVYEYIGVYTSETKAKNDLKEYYKFHGMKIPRTPKQVKPEITKMNIKKEDNPIKKQEILGTVYNKVLRRAGRPFGCSVMTNYYSIAPTDINLDTGKQLKVEWLQPSSFNTDVLINWKTDRIKASDLSVNELEQLIKIV